MTEIARWAWLVARIRLSPTYQVRFAGRRVRFRASTPYTRGWHARNRLKGKHRGFHEPPLTLFLEKAVRERRVMFDIGAHLGYFAILFAAVPPNRALAVEMDPRVFGQLRKAIAFQSGPRRKRLQALHLAVGEAEGEIEVGAESRLDAGRSILMATRDEGRTCKVRVTTLDTLLEETGLKPDFLKIDVEGAEVGVLEGAERLLGELRPLVMIELHPLKIVEMGRKLTEVYEIFDRHGYEMYEVVEFRNSRACVLTTFDRRRSPGNCICVHRADEAGMALVGRFLDAPSETEPAAATILRSEDE